MKFNVRDYGAKGDATSDDSPAFMRTVQAVNASSGGTLFVPAGAYLLQSPITITKALKVTGEGYGGENYEAGVNPNKFRGTILLPQATAGLAACFLVQTPDPVIFENFQVCGLAHPSPTRNPPAIYLDTTEKDTKGFNKDSRIRNVYFIDGAIGLAMGSAIRWVVDACVFQNQGQASVIVQCNNDPDFGDTTITNSTFTGAPVDALLHYSSGGGLKLIGNKFNTYGKYAIKLHFQTQSPKATGAFLISANSIEGAVANISTILLERDPNTPTQIFCHIAITGNEIGAPVSAVYVPNDTNGPWIQGLCITGNTISLSQAPATAFYFSSEGGGHPSIAAAFIGSNTIIGVANTYEHNWGHNTNIITTPNALMNVRQS